MDLIQLGQLGDRLALLGRLQDHLGPEGGRVFITDAGHAYPGMNPSRIAQLVVQIPGSTIGPLLSVQGNGQLNASVTFLLEAVFDADE